MKQIYTLVLLFLITEMNISYGQDGKLDSAFGTDGRAYGGIIASGAGGRPQVLIQADQKIVQIAGPLINGNLDFEILRFLPDGTPDPSFNGNGKLLLNFGAKEVAQCVIQQADGKLVVGGHKDGLIMLVRLNADGTLDQTFNGQGWRQYNILNIGGEQYASGLAVQQDGKIVVSCSVGGGYPFLMDFIVLRINSDGSPDNTFNSVGHQLINMVSGDEYTSGIAVASDGKIIVGGVANGSGTVGYDVAFARLMPDGTLDASFGTGGRKIINLGIGEDNVSDMLLQPDGKILFGGYSAQQFTSHDFVIGRLLPDGTLDNSFGTGGLAFKDFGGLDISYGMDIQADGKIVQSGNAIVSGEPAFCTVYRCLPNGITDSSFGLNGIASFDLGPGHGYYGGSPLQSVKVQKDGKIVAGAIARIIPGAYGYLTNENVLIRLTGTPPIQISEQVTIFTGSLAGRNVLLRWTSYNNDTIDYFNIQRSIDKIHYDVVGTVQAIPNRFIYVYVDGVNNLLENPQIFYRLEVVDVDGNKKYTEVITIDIPQSGSLAKAELTVTGIEQNSEIRVRYDSEVAENGILSVYSADGKLISRNDVLIVKGFNQWQQYLPDHVNGILVVQLRTSQKTLTKKIFSFR